MLGTRLPEHPAHVGGPCLDGGEEVVEGEALDQVLAQDGGRPLPEVHGAPGGDAIADGEHHVQVVDLDLAPDLPSASREPLTLS
jgi:hypothetical protein